MDDPNVKIEPIPDSFIRYSNNWRDGVRQFQLDLQNGRYDPEWLHQAQEARQQRENGDFDDFKEREYEQFWGQKQKVVWNASAGESARVKMKTLIDEGVIQIGDIWKFHYVYGKGSSRMVIEKETRVSIDLVAPQLDHLLIAIGPWNQWREIDFCGSTWRTSLSSQQFQQC